MLVLSWDILCPVYSETVLFMITGVIVLDDDTAQQSSVKVTFPTKVTEETIYRLDFFPVIHMATKKFQIMIISDSNHGRNLRN